MKHYEVVAAIIKFDDKYLCVQRDQSKYDYISYKYEFPGGKVEKNETEECALKREIHEELNMDIVIEEQPITVNHKYPDFKITMVCFLCSVKSPELKLKEHIASQWLKKEELAKLDWAAADVPIVEKLIYG